MPKDVGMKEVSDPAIGQHACFSRSFGRTCCCDLCLSKEVRRLWSKKDIGLGALKSVDHEREET